MEANISIRKNCCTIQQRCSNSNEPFIRIECEYTKYIPVQSTQVWFFCSMLNKAGPGSLNVPPSCSFQHCGHDPRTRKEKPVSKISKVEEPVGANAFSANDTISSYVHSR